MTEYIEQVNELIEANRFVEAKNLLEKLNPTDIAIIFNEAELSFLPRLYRLLPKELAADTFVELSNEMQQALIESFSDSELSETLKNIYADDTVDIIEEMPSNIVTRLLAHCDPDKRTAINELLRYPEDSAGSIMTVEYVDLKTNMTVSQAFEKIRKIGLNRETIYTCYVTDAKRKLVGMVSARTLLLAAPDEEIGNLMEENVISGHTLDPKDDVARKINKYGFLALPITDNENRLVGIVTVDDAMDVVISETEEDILKMSAVTPGDKPYLKTSVFKIFLNRLPWLLVLMISATFTSLIISQYENALIGISVTLFACVPMLMDTGGNAGSQASVTIIRGIALGETMPKDVLKVLWKEIRVALLLGLAISIVCFGKLMLIDSLYNPMTPMIALTVSIALFITVCLAKIIGCTLPLLSKAIKLDPAVVAGPFITTLVDAISLIIYSNIALAILN